MNPILVDIDGSPESHFAALHAVRMANAQERPLHLVSVVRDAFTGPMRRGSEDWFIDTLTIGHDMLFALGQELAPTAGYTCAVLQKRPARAICAEAARVNASVVIIGCPAPEPGKPSVHSVSAAINAVARMAPCEVLAVSCIDGTTSQVNASAAPAQEEQKVFWPGFHVTAHRHLGRLFHH